MCQKGRGEVMGKYDVVIKCETQEEHDRVMEFLTTLSKTTKQGYIWHKERRQNGKTDRRS